MGKNAGPKQRRLERNLKMRGSLCWVSEGDKIREIEVS